MHKYKKMFKHGSPKKRLLGLLMLLVALLCVMLPPLFLTLLFLRHTGWTPLWAGVLACLLWLVVVYCGFWVLTITTRKHRLKAFAQNNPRNMFDEALDALDSIAQGDYDVVVESDAHFRYNELADKINNLAKQLSGMEQMRQDFVSNVSHEIQSPLTSIAGFAQLLRKEELSPEERAHYLDVIQSETERMSKLSDSLLRLSMLDKETTLPRFQPFRLDKQLESVLLAQEPQWASKDLDLDIDLTECCCAGDEDLLLQVWQNLLQNAIKFTPEGGQIYVSLRREDASMRCTIRDTGIGIPPEDQARIFERFYKVDKARDRKMGGNGLGLPLARRIVELHGGQIYVESAPGEGTSFTVVLPCGDKTAETP